MIPEPWEVYLKQRDELQKRLDKIIEDIDNLIEAGLSTRDPAQFYALTRVERHSEKFGYDGE